LWRVKQFEYIQCDVHQFHGIEIEPSAAHIATVALWLTDHQENLRASRLLGGNFNRLPLVRRANIVCANALTTDWATVLLPELCDFVVGNPPFVGKTFQSAAQKSDFSAVMTGIHGAGNLDFVAAWYHTAARYLADAAARPGHAAAGD
jgi:methylase of polypeptide subunit release factors